MKKLLTTLVLFALIATSIFSQTENTNRYPSEKRFITNGFFDNWEISLGAGLQFFSATGYNNLRLNNYAQFKDRLTPEFELGLTKWFVPVFGVRFQAQGAWLYGFANKIDYEANSFYKEGLAKYTTEQIYRLGTDNMERHKLYYTTVQFQPMVNMSAWIGGYNPKRVYEAVLFGGIGWIGTLNKKTDHPKKDEWSGSFGLSNRFRTCKFIDLYIDLKSIVVKNSWYNPQNTSLKIYMLPSLSAGISFRIPAQDFKRVPHCDYAPFYNQIDSLNNALNDAEAQQKQLAEDLKNKQDSLNNTRKMLSDTKNQLDSCQNDLKKKPTVIEKIIIQKPTEEEQKILKESFDAIYFKSGSDKIESISFPSLNKAANILKKYPKAVIKVSGHTDNVGSEQFNIRMSQKRANAVKDYLKRKGVKASISAIGYGPSKPIADNNTESGRAENRRTEIEID